MPVKSLKGQEEWTLGWTRMPFSAMWPNRPDKKCLSLPRLGKENIEIWNAGFKSNAAAKTPSPIYYVAA